MIKYYTKIDGQLVEKETAQEAHWINMSPPFQPEELEELALRYDIPMDFLTDPLDIDERSRYEREEDVRLIIINTPLTNPLGEDVDALFITVPIGIILTPEHVITITAYPNPVLDLFLENRVRYFNPASESLFVLQILERTVYRFLTCLKQLNKQRNVIEKVLYNSSRNKELRQLLKIEKSLVYLVNSLSANELLKMKMKRTDYLKIRDDEDQTDLFEDIIIDNSQALEMANVYTNILNGTMDAYGSIISNNLNITMKRLTSITIILMVPTLVASFFGMNVEIPFDETNPFYIFIIIGVSLVASLILMWYFSRKRFF